MPVDEDGSIINSNVTSPTAEDGTLAPTNTTMATETNTTDFSNNITDSLAFGVEVPNEEEVLIIADDN